MVENSPEFNMIDKNHSDSSTQNETTTNETPMSNMMNIVDVLYMGILDDLIDDCILGVCFEVHRAAKRSMSENNLAVVESHMKEQQITVQCFTCSLKISAEEFARHLTLCMGIGRHKRKACQKILSFKESLWETESSDSDSKPSSSKKKNKKGSKSKKNSIQKQNSENIINYKDMTQEEIMAFYNQHCGVISKRSKMPCKMTRNCSRHTENERTTVRNGLLSDRNEQITTNDSDMNDPNTSNEVIDVDGIDEEIEGAAQISFPS